MLVVKMSAAYLSCDKCHGYITDVNLLGGKQYDRMVVRKHYCGKCILKRIKPYAEKHGCKYVF